MIPSVSLQLDKVYALRFGMGAMVRFEQLTGIKITALDDDDMSGELCAKLLWVMMQQDNAALTLDDVCRLVDDNADSLTEIIGAVGEAIRAAFTVKGGEKNAKKTATKS